jgi:hypothetical protein
MTSHRTEDQRIDAILTSLAHTSVPDGLQQRVAARLAQREASVPARKPIFSLAPLNISACAAVALLAIGWFLTIDRLHRKQNPVVATIGLTQDLNPKPQTQNAKPYIETATSDASHRPELQAQRATIQPSALSTPEALALAQTLAPSQPTPPLPLTPQENLLLRSTRKGQPIEVAELDTLRVSAWTAHTAAREQSRIRQYAEGLLGPLATAQALTPPPSQPDESPSSISLEPPTTK